MTQEEDPPHLFDERFRRDAVDIVHDALLVGLVVGLLAAFHKGLQLLGLPPSIQQPIELLDSCAKVALLGLLSASLLIRFYKRLLKEAK